MLHGGRDRQVPVANVDYLRAQLVASGRSNLFGQLVFSRLQPFHSLGAPEAVEAAIQKVTSRINHFDQNQ